tara:strand:+ start:5903 stop:10669 length:4767 start_codon:yes stop_codon:yes gene_type:complete
MNVLTFFSQQKMTARVWAVFTIVSMLLSALPAAFFVVEAQQPDPAGTANTINNPFTNPDSDIEICHESGNSFVSNSPNVSSIVGGTGHGAHGGDIIPPFWHQLDFQDPVLYPGQNWDDDGMAIYENDCVAPEIDGSISGKKYEDTGNDGSIVGDDTITGWEIRLYEVDQPWVLVATTTTDGHGEYEFSDVPEGSYKVCEYMKEYWSQTFVSNGSTNESPNAIEEGSECQTVNIDKDDESNTVNFGNYYKEPEEEVEYGAYCGDGIVNQEWEQCDGGLSGNDNEKSLVTACTQQCQYISKDPVCTDLTLAQIDVENVENKEGGVGDMTDDIYLGGTPIPNGAWFMVYWNGAYATDTDVSNYEDVPGLAVERSEGQIRSVMHGSQSGADAEHVAGDISFWSWNDSVEATGVSSDDSNGLGKSNKLEGDFADGSGVGSTNASDDEIWIDDGDAYFWLTTTTADDGFYVDYGEPAACEDPTVCEAGVNLIENGGFEMPAISGWSVFYTGEAMLAWITGDEGIEIQNNVAGSPHSGSQHAELDPHNPTMIWQEIATVPGETYKFSTYYSPRPGRDLEDNRFEFMLDGSPLGASIARSGVGNSDTVWTLEEREFVATDHMTTVGFREIGTDTSYGAYIDDVSLVCVPEREELTATLHTSKIVCTDEADLPNWGSGGPNITSNTAADWVAEHDSCELVDGWEFEWAPYGTSDPGDTMTGSANGVWTTFTGSTKIPESAINDGKFWVREVLQEGYIPFTHGPSGNNNSNDVTAEMYCSTDVKNYDNFDRVDNPVADGEYYCVGWNVPDVPDYGPYCGDGVNNQEWEQCDGDDVAEGESCTDYCTFDNQCTDLRLMKITLDQTDSPSFDGTLHLGGAGNMIPSGTWFHFDEDGDDDYVAIANAIDGLAIERDTDNDKLALAFVGGNGARQLDIVQGSIMTLGIDFGAVDRTPNPQFKLEDGSGSSFYDIFEKNGDEGVDFDLRADTGNDGVTVEVNEGEEYNCDECKAEVEARVVLQDGEEIMNNGDGNLLPQVILGDGSVVEFGEWFKLSEAPAPDESAEWIDDPETATNFTDPETLEGLFVSREGDGTVKLALYGYHSPGGDTNYESLRATIEFNDAKVLGGATADMAGNYKLENHSETDGVNSNDNFDSFDEADDLMSVDFDFWVDTKADGITITLDEDEVAVCDDDSDPEEDLYLIDGHKFVQEYDYVYGYEGWTIELYEDESLFMSTTTDENGYYYFWVPEGNYEIHEVIPEGWAQVGVQDGDEYEYPEDSPYYCSVDFEEDEEIFTITAFVQDLLVKEPEWEPDYRCDFYNQKEKTYRLDGYKFEVYGEESSSPASGWTIYATNGTTTLSTTTDMYGYYWFEVPAGMWEVYEEDRSGWNLAFVEQFGGYYLLSEIIDQYKTSCEFYVEGGIYDKPVRALVDDDVQYPDGYRCDFYNEEDGGGGSNDDDDDDDDNGRSTGTRPSGRSGPTQMVLGESTSQCEFLLEYMQMGVENNPWEVTKLQMFLSIVMQYDNPVTGFFDAVTDANVKRFQEQYRSEILDPWYIRDIVPHNEPTGFVYKTTKWKINDIVCPGWDPYPSFEGENLQSNIDLN